MGWEGRGRDSRQTTYINYFLLHSSLQLKQLSLHHTIFFSIVFSQASLLFTIFVTKKKQLTIIQPQTKRSKHKERGKDATSPFNIDISPRNYHRHTCTPSPHLSNFISYPHMRFASPLSHLQTQWQRIPATSHLSAYRCGCGCCSLVA